MSSIQKKIFNTILIILLTELYKTETIRLIKQVLEKFYHQDSGVNEFFKIGDFRIKDFKNIIGEDAKANNQTLKGKEARQVVSR